MREQEDVRNLDWDDTELIRAYNRGMKIQEIAEGKNSKHEKMSLAKQWKVGSNCCAKYSVDGLYYEAKIVSIYGDFCTVEFWGYNDIEKVALKDLEESAGKRARRNQIKISADAAIANMAQSSEDELESEVESTVESVYHRVGKNRKRNRQGNPSNKKDEMYDMPQGTYNYSGQVPDPTIAPAPYAQQYQAPYYVAPPPPHAAQVVPPINEEFGDIAPLLMSWYWAGYHSGMYAGQEGTRSRARAPGPHGHNHCQHAHHCYCHC